MLIALFLSILIVAAATELLLGLFNNLRLVLVYQQFEVRSEKAFNALNQVLRNAGYVGCQKLSLTTAKNLKITPLVIGENKITVQYMDPKASMLIQQAANLIHVKPPLKLNNAEKLIISDCQHIEIATVVGTKQNKQQQEILLSTSLRYRYESTAEVGPLREVRLFVANNIERQRHEMAAKALFLKYAHQSVKNIVPGISALNLQRIAMPQKDGSYWQAILSCELDYNADGLKKRLHKFLLVGF